MSVDLIEFGERLNHLRTEKGLSQEKVAQELGYSKGAISFYELGKRTPDIVFLDAAAKYFDVSFDYLLGRTANKTADPDLGSVCQYTGLSEKAIKNITQFSSADIDVFNIMCETEDFNNWIDNIANYVNFRWLKMVAAKRYRDSKEASQNGEKYVEIMKEAEKFSRCCRLSIDEHAASLLLGITVIKVCLALDISVAEYKGLLNITSKFSNIEFDDTIPVYKELISALQNEIKDGDPNG